MMARLAVDRYLGLIILGVLSDPPCGSGSGKASGIAVACTAARLRRRARANFMLSANESTLLVKEKGPKECRCWI